VTEGELLRKGASILSDAGITDPMREARILWRAILEEDPDAYLAKIAQRAQRMPLSQVLGYRDFYKHRFIVTSDVLDPRPDTETLIETALRTPFTRLLDLGTGSGCILLSLLAEKSAATGLGTDVSQAALEIAAQNAAALSLTARAAFIHSDWFTSVAGQFDLIVSNPPYIAAAEMDDLQPEVRLFEPRCALTDETDGLSAYRAITREAQAHLVSGGRLIFEIGSSQGAAVSALLESAGLTELQVIPDLDGRDRAISGKNP
jgi:release factor glutamine methyltransferase